MKPSAPGEFVREEILEELGLTVAAAEILGVRRAILSDLVNGHAAHALIHRLSLVEPEIGGKVVSQEL